MNHDKNFDSNNPVRAGVAPSGMPVSQMSVDGATLFVSEMTGPTLLTGSAPGLNPLWLDFVVMGVWFIALLALGVRSRS